jgi:hypothetical protein
MKFDDILLHEAVGDDYLYHGTDCDNAESILHANVLRGETDHHSTTLMPIKGLNRAHPLPFRAKEVEQNGRVWGVSLTRSLRFARQWTSGWGAVFVLDRKKLATRHRFVPIDYDKNRREAEEFLLGSIESLDDFLVRIEISGEAHETLLEANEDFLDGQKPNELLLAHPKLVVVGKAWNINGMVNT